MGTAVLILLLVFGLLLVVLLVPVLVGILIYNRLIALRVETETAWSDIDVQLKRRHDLVPNLVQTVKGYASHERETLESVTAARAAAVDVRNAARIREREFFEIEAPEQREAPRVEF